MGNTNKCPYINEAPFRIVLDKEVYYGNEVITGEIIVEPQQTLLLSDIIIKLKLQEYWEHQIGDDTKEAETNTQIVEQKSINLGEFLGVFTEYKSLLPGEYHFPFQLDNKTLVQPSFEYPIYSDKAFLRYTVQAEVQSPYVQLKAEKIFIMKARPIILPTPLSYSSCMNVHNWGFFEKGTTIMKVSYPNNNFRFGDVCPLTVFVDNTRGELDVTEVKVSLVRLVTMKKIAKANQYPFKHSIFEQTFELKVKSKSSFQCSFAFQINDPHTAPHYFMSYNPYEHITDFKQFLPTVDALTISCQYLLVVSCYFDSFVTEGYRPTVNMPITITHQLLNEYKAGENEDADLQKAIAESKEEINNVPLTHEDYGDYTIINKEVPIPINNNNIPNNGPYPNEDNEPSIVAYPHVNDYGPYPILDNEPPHQVEEEQKKEPAPTFVDINEI